MSDLLYFMHPVNTYDTEIERFCLKLLAATLPSWKIENPNQPHHQEGYERYKAMPGRIGMDYFPAEVLPPCRGGAYLPFRDGKVGAGIWKEADWLSDRGFLLWEIQIAFVGEGSRIPDCTTLVRTARIPENRRLTVEETRERIRMPDGSRRPY